MRISRTPYVRGVFEAYQSIYIEHIDLLWGRQLAKSTTIYNCQAYGISQDPGPALFLFPDEKLAKYTSKNRIQVHINGCIPTANKKTPNPDDFSTLEMKFTDSVLSLGWAGSGSQVMSRPVRYLFIDEIDEFAKSVGKGDSSPVKSAYETTSNFGNRKILYTSTPSTPENHIWSDLRSCQHVFEYWVPCPHCGQKQILVWEQIKWPKDERDPEKVSLIAYYECTHCQGHIRNIDKIRILPDGEWRARLVKDPCRDILRNEPIAIENTISLVDVLSDHTVKKIGFQLAKWYSPFPNATFGHAAKEFLEAHQSGDFVKMRDWTKFWKALPWVEKAATREYSELLQNKIKIPPTICPADTIALTCAIDPGQHGFWYTVLAWRQDSSRHLVEYGKLASWEAISIKCFQSTYAVEGQKTARLPIWRVGIDTGGSIYESEEYTMTQEAYIWLRQNQRANVFGIKGDSKPRSGSRLRLSIIDKMPGQKGQIIPGGIALWLVDTSSFKDAVHYHLQVKENDPGRLTFHSATDDTLIAHILAEEKQRNKKGELEWVRVKSRNDLFVTLAYNFAMADQECMGGVRILKPPVYNPTPPQQKQAPSKWLSGIDKLM